MSYLFGTAGWSYKDWEGTVYPVSKPANFNQLQFLSKHFEFVEVNTTFYHIPSPGLIYGWIKKTESLPGFKFWIKIFQNFTHKGQLNKPEVETFQKVIAPLGTTGRLAGVLAQFPYSFKLNSDNLKYLRDLCSLFREFQPAVEFRHKSWDRREILDIFRENRIVWVNIDQPVISLSLPLTAYQTHPDTSYFRLHGRNYDAWFADKGRDARYNYDYSSKELTQISEVIKKLKKTARKIFISGNNHYKGSAVKNLIELKKILKTEESST